MNRKPTKSSRAISVRKALLCAAMFAMLLGVRPAPAADFGAFVGGSIGTTRYDICDQVFELGATYCDDQDTGFKIFGGYKFNRYLAVEGGYVDFGRMYAYTSAPDVTTSVFGNAIYASGMLTIPFAGRAALFGKAGGSFWEGEITGTSPTVSLWGTDSGTGLMYGFGAAFDLSDNYSLRGEWERYDVDDNDVDMLSVGIVLMF
ncbi:MAG: porin family protein [Burkholderiales bacterium]|jgi:OOP family OmpA-OmpF porin